MSSVFNFIYSFLPTIGPLTLQPVVQHSASEADESITCTYAGKTAPSAAQRLYIGQQFLNVGVIASGGYPTANDWWVSALASDESRMDFYELRVTFKRYLPPFVAADEQLDVETIECESVPDEQWLLKAPYFASLASSGTEYDFQHYDVETNAPKVTKLTPKGLLAEYQRGDASVRAQVKTLLKLVPLAVSFFDKCEKGNDQYAMSRPVVRRTRRSRSTLTPGPLNIRQTPPAFASLATVWKKTADRVTRTGRQHTWEQFEEWTGFDSLDTDLYP